MRSLDFILIYMFDDRLEYDGIDIKLKYNWKLSEYGGQTGTGMIRSSTWQVNLAVI